MRVQTTAVKWWPPKFSLVQDAHSLQRFFRFGKRPAHTSKAKCVGNSMWWANFSHVMQGDVEQYPGIRAFMRKAVHGI